MGGGALAQDAEETIEVRLAGNRLDAEDLCHSRIEGHPSHPKTRFGAAPRNAKAMGLGRQVMSLEREAMGLVAGRGRRSSMGHAKANLPKKTGPNDQSARGRETLAGESEPDGRRASGSVHFQPHVRFATDGGIEGLFLYTQPTPPDRALGFQRSRSGQVVATESGRRSSAGQAATIAAANANAPTGTESSPKPARATRGPGWKASIR